MRSKFTLYAVLLTGNLLLLSGAVFSDNLVLEARSCGTRSDPAYSRVLDQTGGMHITASGTLRVLIVFASFPDDETPHAYWPAHNPPAYMRDFIDPDTTTKSQGTFNLTNYFRQMSLGQFHLVGEALWVESNHLQGEYSNGSYGRANTNILQESVDPLVDFSNYDAWTKVADYKQANDPDGRVDMIIMVWRTNMFEYLGEASLGYKPGFVVDGKRIEMGFPENYACPRGSGVTCEYRYSDCPYQAMQTMAHELGHWLLGGLHPYNGTTLSDKHMYWGILCNGLRAGSCANTYERERLGWIKVPVVEAGTNIPLTDYLTTGVAYKYHPANGDPYEYFYIENHQNVSAFDDVTANPDDKGVWILHQQGPYMELDNLRIEPSDGKWAWENPGSSMSCFSQQLPVFAKGQPDTKTGESHRDQIPNAASAVNWLYVYKDPVGQLNCGAFFKGLMFSGAFGTNSSTVFSPYSNPNSNTWLNQPTSFSLEVVNELNGVVTIRYNANPLDAAPGRRYIGPDPAVPGTLPGSLSLAWGAQWADGQPLEADVNWAELQRQVGDGADWNTVYQGAATGWRDEGIAYDSNGTVPVRFRVRVRDIQGKYSVWSNLFYTRTTAVNGVGDQGANVGDHPLHFQLGVNYPNPFNPSTTIEINLPAMSSVRLMVCDMLGREVRRLVDRRLGGGMHAITWDGRDETGTNVPGGVYIYRMKATTLEGKPDSYVSARKMLLLK